MKVTEKELSDFDDCIRECNTIEEMRDINRKLLAILLERSDNNGYAVTPTASPKLPSFYILKKHMQNEINEGLELDHLLSAYHTIKKLGNFA